MRVWHGSTCMRGVGWARRWAWRGRWRGWRRARLGGEEGGRGVREGGGSGRVIEGMLGYDFMEKVCCKGCVVKGVVVGVGVVT